MSCALNGRIADEDRVSVSTEYCQVTVYALLSAMLGQAIMVAESRTLVGDDVGTGVGAVGCWEGTIEGVSLGMVECEGALEGTAEGVSVGMSDCEGAVEGIIEESDGAIDGAGDADGAAVVGTRGEGAGEGASLDPVFPSRVTIVGLRVGLSLLPCSFFFRMASSKASC